MGPTMCVCARALLCVCVFVCFVCVVCERALACIVYWLFFSCSFSTASSSSSFFFVTAASFSCAFLTARPSPLSAPFPPVAHPPSDTPQRLRALANPLFFFDCQLPAATSLAHAGSLPGYRQGALKRARENDTDDRGLLGALGDSQEANSRKIAKGAGGGEGKEGAAGKGLLAQDTTALDSRDRGGEGDDSVAGGRLLHPHTNSPMHSLGC